MADNIFTLSSFRHANEKTDACVVVLACKDYQSLEIVVASLMEYTPPHVPVYIVQNCKGNHDHDRTISLIKHYCDLFPLRIILISEYEPAHPYLTLAKLFSSPSMLHHKYICKIDDDCFPVTHGWFEKLLESYKTNKARYGSKLSYVTPLINNNCWGFGEIVETLNWQDDYQRDFPSETLSGLDMPGFDTVRVNPAGHIDRGGGGTIWRYPEVARWIHERTTFRLDEFIKEVSDLPSVLVDPSLRYSIGCMLFEKDLWAKVGDGRSLDDEHLFHQYCKMNKTTIVCERSVPMIHLFYFTHRTANRDILDRVRPLIANRIANKLLALDRSSERVAELEDRVRSLEGKIDILLKKLEALATHRKSEKTSMIRFKRT